MTSVSASVCLTLLSTPPITSLITVTFPSTSCASCRFLATVIEISSFVSTSNFSSASSTSFSPTYLFTIFSTPKSARKGHTKLIGSLIRPSVMTLVDSVMITKGSRCRYSDVGGRSEYARTDG
ncbi:hypothetical protein BC827DRAFT_1239357 [Russula dissimulans]|nr:hypothetical protein BC827DRAFT_1239357 [Russula dissimulans]